MPDRPCSPPAAEDAAARALRIKFGLTAIGSLVLGFALCLVVCRPTASPGPATTNEAERNVHIDRPDPTTPTGRRTERLTIWRVTGGPEGTREFRTVPEVTAPDGTKDFAIVGTELWTLTIGQRSYVIGPRD